MPYSGPGDDNLPEHVKELSEGLRAQWVAIWNDTYQKCMSESANQGSDSGLDALDADIRDAKDRAAVCEERAFKYANGAVKASVDIANSAALSNYRGAIRSAISGFWSGAMDYDQFWDTMMTTIDAGLTRAWYEGAKEVGILPAELTPEERATLRRMQVSELDHVGSLADRVERNSKANKGKLAPLLAHAESWILRAQDARNQAMVMARTDPKLAWLLGHTAEHCSSCVKLHNKVKRASHWSRVGVVPQNPPNPYLECQGWMCGCTLSPTDQPLSKGPLPRLP